jgi:hypothetical protein
LIRIVRLFAVSLLPLAGLIVASGAASASVQDITVTVQGCVATINNVPEGATTLITPGDITDNPATLVAGDYTATVKSGDVVDASIDFTVSEEGCPTPVPSPSPSPSPQPSPSASPTPCGTNHASGTRICPTPRPTPKPPTTGVDSGPNLYIPIGIVVLLVLSTAGIVRLSRQRA